MPQVLEQFAEERLRSFLIAPTLHRNIEHIPVPIDRPPQIMTLALDRQKDLIEMPPETGGVYKEWPSLVCSCGGYATLGEGWTTRPVKLTVSNDD
jgi:hypothetical protein